MKKEESDKLIAEAAKIIFSYCRTRTSSKEEAEDLSQDILLELLKTQENLRDDRAFYGFMWAVARNVYKNWCKKHGRYIEVEFNENVSDKDNLFVARYMKFLPSEEELQKELKLAREVIERQLLLDKDGDVE